MRLETFPNNKGLPVLYTRENEGGETVNSLEELVKCGQVLYFYDWSQIAFGLNQENECEMQLVYVNATWI